jgi:hypothetical protein
MQAHRFASWVGWFIQPEDLFGHRVEDNPLGQIVDPFARLEVGVQLDQRVGSEGAGGQLLVHMLLDVLVSNVDEALNVGGIIANEVIAQGKDIHNLVSLSVGLFGLRYKKAGASFDQAAPSMLSCCLGVFRRYWRNLGLRRAATDNEHQADHQREQRANPVEACDKSP